MSNAAVRAEARDPQFRIAGVQSASETIGTLELGCRVIGITKGQFSLLDLIKAVLAQTGPASVTLSTWTVGIRDAENAAWLLEKGDMTSLRLLTDRSFVVRQPAYCRRVLEVFGPGAIRATNVHAKFAIIRNDEWAICIRSSMNLNKNRRWEQFDLDDDAAICDHFETLVDTMEDLMPEGPRPSNKEVDDVFDVALEAHGQKAEQRQTTDRERLARLGYTAREIDQRLNRWEAMTDDERGHEALKDSIRESIISSALGGCKDSRKRAEAWIKAQEKEIFARSLKAS